MSGGSKYRGALRLCLLAVIAAGLLNCNAMGMTRVKSIVHGDIDTGNLNLQIYHTGSRLDAPDLRIEVDGVHETTVYGLRRGLFTPVVHTIYITLPPGMHTVRVVSPETGLSAEGAFDMPDVGKHFCLVIYKPDDEGKPALTITFGDHQLLGFA